MLQKCTTFPILPYGKQTTYFDKMLHKHIYSITEAPSFLTEPTDVQISGGNTATFRCEVTGTPEPRILWIQGGMFILNCS